ncbi:unnamed protein product [Parnassius mnemosyne]|uniref:Uncharacterized protein n=1 Tax=Parnassius mnemosyne TaxID=213953 RepID=A0AAV1L2Z5_9NEOP
MRKCLRIPASREQGRVMSGSHRLKPHGIPPHIGRAIRTLSHTSAAPPAPASPWQPLFGGGFLLPILLLRQSAPGTQGTPSSTASNYTRVTGSPIPIRRSHQARKIERSVAPAFPNPAADLVFGSIANQVRPRKVGTAAPHNTDTPLPPRPHHIRRINGAAPSESRRIGRVAHRHTNTPLPLRLLSRRSPPTHIRSWHIGPAPHHGLAKGFPFVHRG